MLFLSVDKTFILIFFKYLFKYYFIRETVSAIVHKIASHVITWPPLMTSLLLQWVLTCVVWIFSVYHRLKLWATVSWIVVLFWNSCEVRHRTWPVECVSKGKALVRPSSGSAIFFPSGLHHMKKPLLYFPATTDGDVPAVVSSTMMNWNPLKLWAK